jgi:hypothetical protein
VALTTVSNVKVVHATQYGTGSMGGCVVVEPDVGNYGDVYTPGKVSSIGLEHIKELEPPAVF